MTNIGHIAESKGNFDSAEYERQLRHGVDGQSIVEALVPSAYFLRRRLIQASAHGKKIAEALDRLPPGRKVNPLTGDVESGPESKENGEDDATKRSYNPITRQIESLDDDQS